MKSKIILFGGTFDPPHNEHVAIAKAAAEEIEPEKLIVMPAFVPPHKKTFNCASPEQRLEMCRLAFEGIKNAEVSDEEIKGGGKSYSYITVGKLAEKYPDSKIYFLMGTDMLESFPKWRYPEKILRFAVPLLCVRKSEGISAESTLAKFKSEFFSDAESLSYEGGEISSTEYKLRRMLGLFSDNFVPDKVDAFVKERGLYPPDKACEFLKTHLKPKRIEHTLGVVLLALRYAEKTGADKNKVLIASLLHDMAKYEDPAGYPDFKVGKDVPAPVVHQFLGAYLAEKELGIKDEEILDAIRYHTSGRANMGLTEKIVLTADKLERGRTFDGVEELRKIADEDFERGFKEALYRTSYKYIKKHGEPVYRLTEEALRDYPKE